MHYYVGLRCVWFQWLYLLHVLMLLRFMNMYILGVQYLDADALSSCITAGLVTLTPSALSPTERGMAVADELVARLLP